MQKSLKKGQGSQSFLKTKNILIIESFFSKQFIFLNIFKLDDYDDKY
jgi:hypothetical protein